MIAYILKVTLCWLFFYGIYELFLKNRTFFKANRSYLMITLILGMVLPLLEFIPWKNESNVAHIIYPVLMEIDDLQAVVSQHPERNFDWMLLLYGIYAFGFVVSMVRFILGISKVLKLYSRSEKIKQDKYIMVLTDQKHLPFSFFKWVFFSKNMNFSNEIEQVLEHEIEHIKGRHSFDVLLSEFLKVIFWCSPMIYLYKKALRQIHEYLADNVVVSNSNKISYKKLLLSQTNNGLQMALTHQFFNSQLKKRLKMINQKRSGRPTLVMYALGIPVLLILLFAFTYSLDKNDYKNDDSISQAEGEYWDKEKAKEVYRIIQDRKSNKPPNLLEYYHETDPGKMPYIQIDGKDIDLPLSNHLSLPGKVGDVLVMVPERAIEKFGSKAKLGYININLPQSGINLNDVTLDTIPKSQKYKVDEEIFKVVEQMPRFPGCENLASESERGDCAKQKLFDFIFENISYPKEAKDQGIEGVSVVQFIVTKTGDIDDVNIVRDIGGGTAAIVNKMMEKMAGLPQKWTPGVQRGKNVNVQYTLPISFKLSSEDKAEVKDGNEKLNKIQESNSLEEIFKVVEQMPRFPGCEEIDGTPKEKEDCAKKKMLEFIYTNVKYPSVARDQGIEGMAVVKFVVRKTGEIDNIELVRDLPGGAGEAALKAVEEMKNIEEKWTPGMQRGKPVNVQYLIPVKFKLEDKEEKEVPDLNTSLLLGSHTYSTDGLVIKEDSKGFNAKGKGFNIASDYKSAKDYPLVFVDGKKWNSALSDVDLSKMRTITYSFPKKDKEHGFIIKFVSKNKEEQEIVLNQNGIASKIQPLFVIDEEEQDLKNGTDINIDPDDIESVNVLKGESAAEKYGEKGKNGVVEIITKKFAKKNKKNLKVLRKVKEQNDLVENIHSGCEDLEDEAERMKCKEEKQKALEDAMMNLNLEVDERNGLELPDFKAYPNPAKGFINLSFTAKGEPIIVEAFDLGGKKVFEQKLVGFDGQYEQKLEFEGLDSNFVLIRITQNDKVFIKKMIIE